MGRPKKGELPKPRKRTDGRYEVRLSIDGKVRSFYGDTAGQATTNAIQGKADYDAGVNRLGGRATLRKWANKQIHLCADKSDLSTYKYRINFFADSALGDMPIIKIGYSDIQTQVNKLSASGRTERTVKRYIDAIKSVFALAVLDRALSTNPCDGLKIPKTTKKKDRRIPIEQNQIEWIASTFDKAQLPSMIMLYSGLRRGELAELTWGDIDMDNRVIHITKAYDYKHNQVKSPKTYAGKRDVHMCTRLADFLLQQQWGDDNVYVVQKKRGGRMTESAWKRWLESYLIVLDQKYGGYDAKSKFDPMSRKAGEFKIKPWTWHMLRHTYCTMLHAAGVDVVVASREMGHADITTTLGIYTHCDYLLKEMSLEQLDAYVTAVSTGDISHLQQLQQVHTHVADLIGIQSDISMIADYISEKQKKEKKKNITEELYGVIDDFIAQYTQRTNQAGLSIRSQQMQLQNLRTSLKNEVEGFLEGMTSAQDVADNMIQYGDETNAQKIMKLANLMHETGSNNGSDTL